MDEQQIVERKIELQEALGSVARCLEIEYSLALHQARETISESLVAWCETHGLER